MAFEREELCFFFVWAEVSSTWFEKPIILLSLLVVKILNKHLIPVITLIGIYPMDESCNLAENLMLSLRLESVSDHIKSLE